MKVANLKHKSQLLFAFVFPNSLLTVSLCWQKNVYPPFPQSTNQKEVADYKGSHIASPSEMHKHCFLQKDHDHDHFFAEQDVFLHLDRITRLAEIVDQIHILCLLGDFLIQKKTDCSIKL